MVIRPRPRQILSEESPPAIVRLWLLRMLVPLRAHKEFVNSGDFSNDGIAAALGYERWLHIDPDEFDAKAVRTQLRHDHAAAESARDEAAVPASLAGNVARLGQLIGLSGVDVRLLEFAVLLHSMRMLDICADMLGRLTSVEVFRILSTLLDLPEAQIRTALSTQGLLARSGLLAIDRNGSSNLRSKLELLSDTFADQVFSFDADPVSLLRDTVVPAPPAELTMADFAHITPALAILRPYLRNAVRDGRAGVNVMVHGAPGTGKNQLSRALAGELDCELFEVASENTDGDPVLAERRLRAFRAAQNFFTQRRALIVFDEVEDVFGDGDLMLGRQSTAQQRKAWINRMLEQNAVPTIWLSNSIHGIDPAFMRRFDMVIELPIPPKQQRARIIRAVCGDALDERHIARFAESEALAPAVVARMASVVASVRNDLGATAPASALEQLLSSTLAAQGHATLRSADSNRLAEVYDPRFIDADHALDQLAEGLKRAGSGRLCLYGPPGTGKTAYARYLAEQLGMPLQVRRASDLMSKWLGDNEKNIARAFRAAEQDGALLLIDEVDSFLQDRRGAQRSWELTMVNEMLTQMESFSGILVASTNLMSGLDQAALRRFDLKVRFGYLQPDAAGELLQRYATALAIAAPPEAQLARLRRLANLTPGDFAAVARQHRFRPLPDCAALVAALEAECGLKDSARSSIGFV